MVEDDYVSFELAQLLVHCGFDEPCISFYDKLGNVIEGESIMHSCGICKYKNSDLHTGNVSRPTLRVAQKWLEEKEHIIVMVGYNGYYYYELFHTSGGSYSYGKYGNFKTYSEALEKGIKDVLKDVD